MKRSPEILVIAALREEISVFIESTPQFLLPNPNSSNEKTSAIPYWEPAEYKGKVGFWCCGVGGKRAGKSLNRALKLISPCRVIIPGFAGALTDELVIGDLVVVNEVSHWQKADTSLEQFNDAETKKLCESLENRGILYHRGGGACSDRMVDAREDKEMIRDRLSALCVDMESYYLLKRLNSYKIPTVMVRVISDLADESLGVDFKKIPRGKWAQRRYFMLHPARYMAFRKVCRTAQATTIHLFRALEAYIQQ